MQKLKIYFLMLFLFSFFVSCTETVAPVLTGNISGFVDLSEENGTQIKDRSGVKVSIEGRSNYTFTNSDGRFTLENIEAGIFNIVFEKEGFGLYKIIAHQFVGGGTDYLYSQWLVKLPSYNVTYMQISTSATQPEYMVFDGSLSGTTSYSRGALFFFGKSESISNNPQDYLFVESIYLETGSSQFQTFINTYDFLRAGFNLGDTIYVAAYSSSYFWNSIPDPVTGKYFYYNVGSTPFNSSFVLE